MAAHAMVVEPFGNTASMCADTTGSSHVGMSRRIKEWKMCVE